MSKSVKRVRKALLEAGLPDTIQEMPESTRTAEEAAAACGCVLDQMVKSLMFVDETDRLHLLLVAGGNRAPKAVPGHTLTRADPTRIREETGFAIGGVSPIGHLSHPITWLDTRLLDFDQVWAAAGTPRHVFSIDPNGLATLTKAKPL